MRAVVDGQLGELHGRSRACYRLPARSAGHEPVSRSVVRFGATSGCALNFSAQIGASAATTAFSASPFASFRVVPALVQPKPNARTAHHTTAPPAAPQSAGFTSGGIFMGFFLSHLEKKGFPLSPFELSTVCKYCVNINRCDSAAEKSVISKGAHAHGTSTDPVSMGF